MLANLSLDNHMDFYQVRVIFQFSFFFFLYKRYFYVIYLVVTFRYTDIHTCINFIKTWKSLPLVGSLTDSLSSSFTIFLLSLTRRQNQSVSRIGRYLWRLFQVNGWRS